MSVFQVEEYYVFVQFDEELSEDGKQTLRKTIEDEGYDSYEITSNSVTVDGVESERDGKLLESKLMI